LIETVVIHYTCLELSDIGSVAIHFSWSWR